MELQFNIPSFIKPALYNDTKYSVISSGRRCFSGDTLVLTPKGYKKISAIKTGEIVYSYNQNGVETKPVENTHTFAGGVGAKPMLKLKYNNSIIKCTYDHEIYAKTKDGKQEGWVPAFIFAWGKMEAHQKHKLKILCEQQGKDINKELQMHWSFKNHEAGFRWLRVLQNSDKEKRRQVPYYKTTQGGCKSMDTKLQKQALYKSFGCKQDKQQHRKSRVVYKKRKRFACGKTWQAIKKLGRKVWNSCIKRDPGKRHKDKVETISKQKRGCKTVIQTVSSYRQCYTRYSVWQNMEVSVIDVETTYDLTVKDNHNYFITTNNLLVHNTGKTYNTIQWLLESLLTNPKAKAALHVDTTQSNLTAYLERYYKPMLKPIWHLCKWNGQRYVLTLPGDKYIDFGSAQKPENLEGFEYDYALLNEAGIILRKESLWYESLEPMFQHAQVRIVGTPKAKNLFHKLYVKGQSGEPDYKSFQFSSYDSPYVSDDIVNKAKEQLPQDVFRQNYLAEFIEGAGAVFRNISECIKEPPQNLQPDIMAIDLAKHQDFTVITLANTSHKQVISMDRFNQIDWSFQKKRIVNTWQNSGHPKIIIDSTGVGEPIYDDLKNAGVNIEPFKFTNTSKADLIKGLSLAMDSQQIHYPNIDYLVSELEVFGYEVTAMGNIRYNAPEGFHDDAVISLALANHLMQNEVDITIGWI